MHCYAHCLNLAEIKLYQLPIICNVADLVNDVFEDWIVIPEERFPAQYLILSMLASLTQEREQRSVFAPFLEDLSDRNLLQLEQK